jgi:hypothetical protein
MDVAMSTIISSASPLSRSNSCLNPEDSNLEKIWSRYLHGALTSQEFISSLPPLPEANAPAAQIRAWMQTNKTALQHINTLSLSNLDLSCVPNEIRLFTAVEVIYLQNNLSLTSVPQDLFRNMVKLQVLQHDYSLKAPDEVLKRRPKVQFVINITRQQTGTPPSSRTRNSSDCTIS